MIKEKCSCGGKLTLGEFIEREDHRCCYFDIYVCSCSNCSTKKISLMYDKPMDYAAMARGFLNGDISSEEAFPKIQLIDLNLN